MYLRLETRPTNASFMNKFIHHEGRLNNNMQKWRKEKEKENKPVNLYRAFALPLQIYAAGRRAFSCANRAHEFS